MFVLFMFQNDQNKFCDSRKTTNNCKYGNK